MQGRWTWSSDSIRFGEKRGGVSPSSGHSIEECLSKWVYMNICWTQSRHMAHLYDEGASGWKEQTSPSSISSLLPQAVAGSHEVCRGWWPAAMTDVSQTTPAAGTRTVWRFPPRNPHRRRIWIRGPSCWTRCLTVSRSTWQVLNKARRETAWTQISLQWPLQRAENFRSSPCWPC